MLPGINAIASVIKILERAMPLSFQAKIFENIVEEVSNDARVGLVRSVMESGRFVSNRTPMCM